MRRLIALPLVLITVAAAAAVLVTSSARSDGGPYTVRAIFDDASYAADGEDVRVAGANVGSIQSFGVTANNEAAVTISIGNRDFVPFYSNAHCTIRPQSLVGEEYVDCSPGTAKGHRQLAQIKHGPGAGAYYLPVTQTSSPIDSDIVQDISTMPVQQALSVVIDELGTGLATRGSDLNAVIHRANPALANTDKVFSILAKQNKQLAQLAVDGNTVLTPLAHERKQIAGFVTAANTTAVAAAARAQDISKTLQLFPSFLGQLRPLLGDLSTLANQGTPLMTDLGQSAGSLGQEFGELKPFASTARTALVKLGSAAQQSEAPLVASQPLAKQLLGLGTKTKPSAQSLDALLTSLDKTGGIDDLMTLLFNGSEAGNSYNSLGHYVNAYALNESSCVNYTFSFNLACSAKFSNPVAPKSSGTTKSKPADDSLVDQAVDGVRGTPTTQALGQLLGYLTGKSSQ